MVGKTDPAREIADICRRLAKASDAAGDVFIAKEIGVAPWSRDFFEVIFSILDRIELVKKEIECVDLDDDNRNEAIAHLEKLAEAFSKRCMNNAWNSSNHGYSIVSGKDATAISFLSAMIRPRNCYPKLSDDEIKEIVGAVASLIEWLEKQQLSEQDFIREALIEGLRTVRRRLVRLGWLGWGYSISSLRDVIGAYLALERGNIGKDNPSAEAILKKTGVLLEKIGHLIGVAKDAKEKGQFILELYGLWALAKDTGVVALLTSSGVNPAP